MRTVPLALQSELIKEANALCHLIELYLSSTYRFTDFDFALTYDANTYTSRGLSVSAAEYSVSPQVDKLTLQVDNVDKTFSAIILAQEVRGKKCVVRLAALKGRDVVINGGFEFGDTEGWTLYVDTGAGAAATVAANAFEIWEGRYRGLVTITNGGVAEDDIQLHQPVGSIVNTHQYKVSFAAKAVANRTIKVKVLKNVSPYTNYGLNQSVSLTPSWKHFDYTWTANQSAADARLGFYLGNDTNNVSLDVIEAVPVTDRPPPATVLAVSVIFSGVIDRCTLDQQRVRFDVFNPFIFWQRKVPRRLHSPTCPWPFKDATFCKYSGVEAWCDKSFDRCEALGVSDNFGGFRFLPALVNRKIWWGRSG